MKTLAMKTLASGFRPAALIAILGALVMFAAAQTASSARAADGVRLTDAVKQHLIAAQPVRDDAGVERDSFDGKPVLVLFFASW
jgi:hypothetical protein